VDRLLEEFHMDYRPPQKIKTMTEHHQRDAQFQHIALLRRLWAESGERR
jgi:hypothetical protein